MQYCDLSGLKEWERQSHHPIIILRTFYSDTLAEHTCVWALGYATEP